VIAALRRFDAVGITGLASEPGFVEMLLGLFRDAESRALLDQAVAAAVVLEGDADPEDKALAQVRLDEARDGLEALGRGVVLWLEQERAIEARNVLHRANLGAGRRDFARGATRRLA